MRLLPRYRDPVPLAIGVTPAALYGGNERMSLLLLLEIGVRIFPFSVLDQRGFAKKPIRKANPWAGNAMNRLSNHRDSLLSIKTSLQCLNLKPMPIFT